MIKGACYVRVSTDNQLENYSIEEQTDRLKAYCMAKDITIVKFYTDGGFSGGNLNRPSLRRMLEDIRRKKIDSVIVYKLDRLSRSQKDTLMLIEDEFLANNVDFISVSENFDTSIPLGRAMIGILSVFAQLEKDQITERFTMGRIGRAKNGFFHGGAYPPTGYDYMDGLLVVNEYEALQVKDLYNRFVKGYSVYDCWRYMQKRYTNKYGGWKSQTLVRNVLKNEVYIGKVKFKGNVYQGIHQAIVPEPLFRQAQAILESPRQGIKGVGLPPFKAGTLLSGMVYCGKCGARFHGEHGNYSCYSRTKGDKKYIVDPDCKNKKWKITELDSMIISYLSRLEFEALRLPVSSAAWGTDHSKRIHEIERQMNRLMDLYQVGGISMETIAQRTEALSKEKAALLEDAAPPGHYDAKDSVTTAKEAFLTLIKSGNLQEKRACLKLLIDRIVINDDDIHIFLREL